MRQWLLEEGNTFRTTPKDRADFVSAFKRHHRHNGDWLYNLHKEKIEEIKRAHPEVAHIPTEDLIALRGWTSEDYRMLRDALDNPKPSMQLDIVLPYVKAIISAYHALPDSFIYSGPVYTVRTRNKKWIERRYQVGEIIHDWQILSASKNKYTNLYGNNINFETLSIYGKDISLFSESPSEEEVLFIPGTLQRILAILIKENPAQPDFPYIDIKQEEVAPARRTGLEGSTRPGARSRPVRSVIRPSAA